MKDENKTKVELIKELKFLREEREKGVFKDITKLKQAEQVIRESESRCKELFNHMSSGVAVYEAKDNGKDFIIKDFNRAAEKIDKVNKEDIIGESVLKVFPRVKDFGLFKVFQEVYKTGKPQHHPISFYKDQRITGWRENHVYKLSSGEIVAVYDDITERKQAEDAKHREELLSKSIVDNMPAGIAFLDNDFVLRWFNRTYAELIQTYTPYTGEQTLGMSYFDYAVGSRSQVEEWFQKVRDTGQVDTRYGFELVLKKDGLKKTTYWDTSVAPVLDVDGKVKGILILTQDVTVRKQAEKELKDSEERLKILFDYAPDAYYISDLKGNFIDGNIASERVIGYKREELIGSSFLKLKLLSLADAAKAAKLLVKNLRGQPTGPNEFILNRKDKSKVTVEISTYPVKIKGRTLVLGIARDITERKQADEEIRLHAAMMVNVAEGVYLIGLDDLLIKWTNEKFTRMFGYDPGEMVGKQVDMVNAPTERAPTETRIAIVDVLKETGEWHGEVKNIKRDGTHFWCYANVSLFEHPEYGKVIVAVHTDITKRKQAEDKLLKNQYYLTKAQEMGIIGTWELDIQKNILIWTDENYKIFGVPLGTEINHELFLNCIHPDDRDYFHKKWSARLNNKPYDTEFRLIVNDKVKWVREKADIEFDTEGNPIMAIGFTQDITERKQAEEETRQKTEDLVLINILNDAVNQGDSLLEILQLLARETKRVFSCHGVTAYLLSEDREHLVMQTLTLPPAMISRVEKLIGMRIPTISILLKTGSLYRKVLQDGKPQLINDPKTIQGLIAEFTENKILKKLVPKIYSILGTRSLINVPLVSESKAIGLLDIYRKEPFTEFDLKRFETISRQLTSIIERKQAEENIKNAKDELQIIMDSVPAIIFYKDTEGKIIRTNKTNADIFGIPVKDMIGKTTEELFPKEQAKKMRKDDQEVIISGKAKKNIIQSFSTPDGIRWQTIDKIPHKDKEGKVTGVIGFAKDITVQRKSEQKLKQTYQRLKKTMDATIDTMSKIIEAKDPYTSDHQHRVCQLAVPLAQELGLSKDKVEGIRIASLIHDIGKIGLPTEILSKPTTLTDIEFSLIKGHSQIGYDILKSIDFSYPIAQIVLQHHEKLNGSGYPNKLKGDEIILEAKIIGVADIVEAMSSHRPYRPALGVDKALEEISQNRGILYDPEIVDACIRLFKEKGFKFE